MPLPRHPSGPQIQAADAENLKSANGGVPTALSLDGTTLTLERSHGNDLTVDMSSLGGGDMTKAIYDTNNNGIVDEAAALTGFVDNSADWNAAFGWGDHASAGYLTSASLKVWKAKGNNSSASVANTTADLAWDAFAIDGGSDVTVSGSAITIATAGTYEFHVSLRTDNGNRTELFIRTEIDAGSGYSEDADELVSNYVSRDNDQDTGGVVLSTVLAFSAGDKIKFVGEGDCDGSCVILDPGTRLIIKRLA